VALRYSSALSCRPVRVGSAASRAGVVEIWTHPPGNRRDKTLIATLKKGQSFGEMAILNDEPRAEVRSRLGLWDAAALVLRVASCSRAM
jgi:hypothetical protein